MDEKRVKIYKILGIILLIAAILFAIITTFVINAKQKKKDGIQDDIDNIPTAQFEIVIDREIL